MTVDGSDEGDAVRDDLAGLDRSSPDHPGRKRPTTPLDWTAVAVVALAVFAVTTTEMVPVGLLPFIADDLHVTEGQAGYGVSVYGVLAGLMAPVATVITGRVDRRTLLLSALAVFTIGNALAAASNGYAMFIASRLTCGLIHGLVWSIIASVAIRLVAKQDAVRATATAFCGISVALVLGIPCAAWIGHEVGWRWAFAVLSGLCALTLVLLRLLLPPLPSRRTLTFGNLASLLESKAVGAVLIVTGCIVVGNYCAYTYTAPFLRARGVDAGLIGAFLLCYGIAGVVGNVTAAALIDTFRTMRPVLAGLTSTATAMLLLLLIPAHSPAWLIIVLAIWGAAYSALPVALQTLVLRVGGDGDGEAATSLYVMAFNCAIAAGALSGGFAIDSGGPLRPILLGALVSAGGIVGILAVPEARGTATP